MPSDSTPAFSTLRKEPVIEGPSYLMVIAFAVVAAAVVVLAMPAAFTRRLMYLQNDVWYAPREFGLDPGQLAISPSGAVWSAQSFDLVTFDGGRYTHHSANRLGTGARKKLRGGIAFRNGEVWAAHEEGVLRFDGTAWRLYPEALKTARPESIAANRDGVWVVDDSGHLSHFDGSSWSITDLSAVLPRAAWGNSLIAGHPKVALAADGALWIVWRGLWRFDGRNWREILPNGAPAPDAGLVGEAGRRLWFVRGRDILQAVNPSGDVTAQYTRGALGLGPKSVIGAVAEAGNLTYVGTSEGLIVLGDGIRQRIAAPKFAPVITRLAVSPQGAIFALADQPPNFLALLRPLTSRPYNAIVFALLLLIVVTARRRLQPRSEFPPALSPPPTELS
jgi:hypothetical protein